MERYSIQPSLNDKEIIEKAYWWVEKLIESNGKDFVMHVPTQLNHDTDLVLFNTIKRFENLLDKYTNLQTKYDNILATEDGHLSQTENVWQSGYAAGHDVATDKHKAEFTRIQKSAIHYANRKDEVEKERNALRAKVERYEKVLRELNCAYDPTRDFVLIHKGTIKRSMEAIEQDGEKEPVPKQEECPNCGAPCRIIEKTYKEEIHDVHYVEYEYAPQQGPVTTGHAILKPGFKFRNTDQPLNLYEVLEVDYDKQSFTVKITRQCQVSGKTWQEIWSIDGFNKYYYLGHYYAVKEVKQ